jgi:hypothetical protein
MARPAARRLRVNWARTRPVSYTAAVTVTGSIMGYPFQVSWQSSEP